MVCGSISETASIFWNILGSTYWLQSIQKSDTRNFCLFVYFRSYNDKQCCQSATPLISVPAIFAQSDSIVYLALTFLYTLKKNVEKLCKVLEMKLKTYTSVTPKFFSRKSNLMLCIIFKIISFTNSYGSVKIRLWSSKLWLLKAH